MSSECDIPISAAFAISAVPTHSCVRPCHGAEAATARIEAAREAVAEARAALGADPGNAALAAAVAHAEAELEASVDRRVFLYVFF